MWAFHGDADDTIPVTESRRMAEALRLSGGNAAYTEFAGVGHDAWDPAFAEPDLVPWLLAQKRGAPGRRPKPSTAPVLYTGATVYAAWNASPATPAILVEGGGVRFVGAEREARALAPEARVVDLGERSSCPASPTRTATCAASERSGARSTSAASRRRRSSRA